MKLIRYPQSASAEIWWYLHRVAVDVQHVEAANLFDEVQLVVQVAQLEVIPDKYITKIAYQNFRSSMTIASSTNLISFQLMHATQQWQQFTLFVAADSIRQFLGNIRERTFNSDIINSFIHCSLNRARFSHSHLRVPRLASGTLQGHVRFYLECPWSVSFHVQLLPARSKRYAGLMTAKTR